ncbi:Small ubiquitin-related modifier 2 [Sparganum proliferum]
MTDASASKEKSNEPINLTVHGQDGSVIHFKIKRTTPLKKLMTAYCDRLGLTLSNVRFTCDGEHVQQEDTPESPPYKGPFRIVSRGEKTLGVEHKTREEVMSVDRLRTAVPDTPGAEPCGPMPLRLPDPISLAVIYFLFLHVRYHQLQLPHQPFSSTKR